MLDQAFSAENFRRIYDFENRRGRNVDRMFFPQLVEASARIGSKAERIRDIRRASPGLTKAEISEALKPVYEELAALRKERDEAVEVELGKIAEEVSKKGYQLRLDTASGPDDMKLYPLPKEPEAYFVGKQLQRNLARLYKVKPGDRRAIISQMRDILSTKFNMYVIRTDIKAFYESVERSTLIRQVDNDQLLSLSSKSHIKCILKAYGNLSASSLGLPRGVGISAYLSEIYMRILDDRVAQLDGLTYYARYVDDIIAIFSPTAMDDTSKYLKSIEDIFALKGLRLNSLKTSEGHVGETGALNFEYLGYAFTVSGGKCELDMSSSKVNRYKSRLDRCFSIYDRESLDDQKGAAKKLAARIKFLTGNTRLVNSKAHAYTGIYYSNSHLTKLGKLGGLDAYMRHLASKLSSSALQDKIYSHSFKRGFEERTFYRYNTKDIAAIVRAWRYEA